MNLKEFSLKIHKKYMFSHFDLESSMIGQKHWFYMVVTLFMLELILFGRKLKDSIPGRFSKL